MFQDNTIRLFEELRLYRREDILKLLKQKYYVDWDFFVFFFQSKY
jgi:hypothetical protein